MPEAGPRPEPPGRSGLKARSTFSRMATPPSSASTSSNALRPPGKMAGSRAPRRGLEAARASRAGLEPAWELIVDPPSTGAANMARDRALLEQLVRGERPATLRFYGWSPPCISLRLGQREEILDLEAVRRAGLDVVRRPTGGQALLHDRELTYSVVASLQDPVVGGTLMHSYHAISEALLAGLRELGVDGEGAPCEPRPASGLTADCFASASAEEGLVEGRKLLAR